MREHVLASSLPVLRSAAVCPPALAQSPNTSTIVVVVVDQTGAVVTDAKVRSINTATGAVREATSGSDGSATIAALSLTGTYTVTRVQAGLRHRGARRTSRCAPAKRRR